MAKHAAQPIQKPKKQKSRRNIKSSHGVLGLLLFLILAGVTALIVYKVSGSSSFLFGRSRGSEEGGKTVISSEETGVELSPAAEATPEPTPAPIVWDTQTVVYEDESTEIVMRGDAEMDVEYGSEFIDPCVEIRRKSARSGDEGELVKAVEMMTTDNIGKFKIHYLVVHEGEEMSFDRIINVVDTTPPEITVRYPEGEASGSWMSGYGEPTVSAHDLLDGDLSEQVAHTRVNGVNIYSVTDSQGNEAVLESEPPQSLRTPEIMLEGGEDYTFTAAMVWEEPGWSLSDTDGTDLSELVQVSGYVTPYKLGDYTLSYQASNGRGDTVTARRTVHVVAAERKETVFPEQNTIYLTFDDGPGPYTDRLLDILAQYDVKATFFITGNYPDYYDCIKRAYDEGHTIAVHTFCHDYRQIYRGVQGYFDDFMKCEELIHEYTGTYTRLFRFPGGSSNTVSSFNPGIMGMLATYMRDMGYYYFDWNVSSGDAQTVQIPTYQVYYNVINGVQNEPGTAWVVLQHDVKDFSVAAVEDIIKWGLENGYQFLPLQEDSYAAHHWIYN